MDIDYIIDYSTSKYVLRPEIIEQGGQECVIIKLRCLDEYQPHTLDPILSEKLIASLKAVNDLDISQMDKDTIRSLILDQHCHHTH